MTLAALNAWLMSDGVRADVNVLTRLTVRTELDNLAPDASGETPEIDWTRLLFAGSTIGAFRIAARAGNGAADRHRSGDDG